MDKSTKIGFKGFIVGQGRSGTTLFSAMLNRHSKICVTPETQFFQFLDHYPESIEAFIQHYPDSLRKIFSRMDATSGWTPDPEPIIQQYPIITNKIQINQLFLMLGSMLAAQHNKPFWLEKTPNHIRHIPLIDELSSESLIIHIIRDGRSVAESLGRMNWASSSFVENCVRWQWTMRFYYRFLEKRKNVLNIRYEDLITNTEPTLKKVCHFLGLEYESSMLEPSTNDDYLIETGHQHKNKIKGAIDPSNINLWRKKVSQSDQVLAERLLAHELKRWHYPVELNDFKPNNRIIISPFVPTGETRLIMDQTIRTLMQAESELWLDKTINLGEKIVLPPRYWLQFDELLSRRFAKDSPYSSYRFFMITLSNLLTLKIRGTHLVFYYNPDLYNNCTWNLKRLLVKLTLKLANKVIVPNKDYSDLERYYGTLKQNQKT